METNTFSAWHYIFELVTSISVPNFMLVSKSAQFPLNLELRRQTMRPLPPEETVATRAYIKQCYKLFKMFNNLEVGQSFPGGSSVCSNASSRITHHSKDHVQA